MSTTIKSINISAFRGIPDLELELNGKSLLLKGDNGTGKSSIVDALEFFFCGCVTHLEGVQGISMQKHAPHISYSQDDVKVKITFNPGDIELERSFNSEPKYEATLKEYFDTTQKGVFILRRDQILSFITSKPAERFRTIGSIIGIEDLDDVELTMMHAKDTLQIELNKKNERKKEIYRQLSQILDTNITTIDSVSRELNNTLKVANLPLIRDFKDIEKHAEEMLVKAQSEEAVKKFGRLEQLSIDTKSISINKEKTSQLVEKVNGKIRKLLDEGAKRERYVADLLRIGADVLEIWQSDICPLCQQEINRDDVLSRVKERLEIVRALSDEASEIRIECATLKESLEGISKSITSIAGKSKEGIPQFSPILPQHREEAKDNIEGIYTLFKSFVSRMRPKVDIEEVSSGKVWTGSKALELGLIDKISTSEETILELSKSHEVLYLDFKTKQSESNFAKLLKYLAG